MDYYLKEKLIHGDDAFHLSVYKNRVTGNESTVLYTHWHSELEMLYIEQGGTCFNINGREYEADCGDILFIMRNTLHGAYEKDRGEKEDIVFTAILFGIDFVQSASNDTIEEKYLEQLLETTGGDCFHIRKGDRQSSVLKKLIREITSFYQTKPKGYELFIKSKLFEILYYFVQWKQENFIEEEIWTKKVKGKSLKTVISYINIHYADQISLEDLADTAHISVGHLCRLFRETLKTTPVKYIQEVRMKEAVRLLKGENLSITEIALLTGFTSSNYFTMIFKKKYGCTPSSIRGVEYFTS